MEAISHAKEDAKRNWTTRVSKFLSLQGKKEEEKEEKESEKFDLLFLCLSPFHINMVILSHPQIRDGWFHEGMYESFTFFQVI